MFLSPRTVFREGAPEKGEKEASSSGLGAQDVGTPGLQVGGGGVSLPLSARKAR